jgi:hypothetical protein
MSCADRFARSVLIKYRSSHPHADDLFLAKETGASITDIRWLRQEMEKEGVFTMKRPTAPEHRVGIDEAIHRPEPVFPLGEDLREQAMKDATLAMLLRDILKAGSVDVVLEACHRALLFLSTEKMVLHNLALGKLQVEVPIIQLSALGDSMRSFQMRHGTWSRKLFPDQSQQSMIDHLRDEVLNEVYEDCHPHELADVVMLTCAIANKQGVDLWSAMEEKFEIVKKREWDTSGPFPAHIKDPCEDGCTDHCQHAPPSILSPVMRGPDPRTESTQPQGPGCSG